MSELPSWNVSNVSNQPLFIWEWFGMAPTIFAQKPLASKFRPPGAPHHSGFWERFLRSVKFSYDLLGSMRVTENVSGTLLCLIKQALNSKQTFQVITHSRELEALTQIIFCLGNLPQEFLHFHLGNTSSTRKGTCERKRNLTLFGLVGFEKL